MTDRRQPRVRPPIDQAKLDEMALSYVGRFATSRAKLLTYLKRKLRERGWAAATPPDLDALADKMVRNGYVDDRAFAVSKARTLTARGYGIGRVRQALHGAGIGENDGEEARELAQGAALDAAIRFAQRRRLGPYATATPDPKSRERGLAAMLRAGHSMTLARRIMDCPPGRKSALREFHEN